MLHGALALHAKSGGLLFSKCFSPSFGLPEVDGMPAMDPHRFASVVFALQINASAATVDQSKSHAALQSVEFGSIRVALSSPEPLPELQVVLVLDKAVSPASEKQLLLCFSTALASKFAAEMSTQTAQNRVRKLKGASGVLKESLIEHVFWLLIQAKRFAIGDVMWAHALLVDLGLGEKDEESDQQDERVRGQHSTDPEHLPPASNCSQFHGVAASGTSQDHLPQTTGDDRGKKKRTDDAGTGVLSSLFRSVKRKRSSTQADRRSRKSTAPLLSFRVTADGRKEYGGACVKADTEESAEERAERERSWESMLAMWEEEDKGAMRVEVDWDARGGDWEAKVQPTTAKEEDEEGAGSCGCGGALWRKRSERSTASRRREWTPANGGCVGERIVGVGTGALRLALCVRDGSAETAQQDQAQGHGQDTGVLGRVSAHGSKFGGGFESLEEVASELCLSLKTLHRLVANSSSSAP